MIGNPNRSFSNPPLRELNSISATQKIPSNLVSPKDQTIINKNYQKKELNTSYELSEKKIGGIEGDRSVLINRINKLQQEIDHLNKENSDLYSKIHHEKARFEEFQKKFIHSSKVKNLVDRNYQGDLKYEKEENSRLKHLLHSLEVEKNELKLKIKNLEDSVSSNVHEKQDLMTRLQQKIDHVSIIEGDNRILVDRLGILQNKFYLLEKENHIISHENINYKSLVSTLEEQNSQIITRIQEECSKYNNFVNAKNNELENLKWAFRRQAKVISAKAIASEMQKIIANRLMSKFCMIKFYILSQDKKLLGIKKLYSEISLINHKKLKTAFKAIAADMIWVDSHKITQNLSEKFHTRKFMTNILRNWKKVSDLQTKKNKNKSNSSLRLCKLINSNTLSILKKKLSTWKNFMIKLNTRQTYIIKMIKKSNTGWLKYALNHWSGFSKAFKNLQFIEDLSSDFASKLFKAKVFYCLREYIKISNYRKNSKKNKIFQAKQMYKLTTLTKFQRYTASQRQKLSTIKKIIKSSNKKDLNAFFQIWKLDLNKVKQHNLIENLVACCDLKREKGFVKTVFLAWKNYLVGAKLETNVQALAVERPAREDLEKALGDLSQEHSKALQLKSIKTIANPLFKSLRLCLNHWKALTVHFKSFLPSVKHLFFKKYHLSLFKAFTAWNLKRSIINFQALAYTNEKNMKEKIELNQSLLTLKEITDTKQDTINNIKSNRLKKCIGLMQHKDLITGMRKWANRSFIISNKRSSACFLALGITKVVCEKAFGSIKSFCKAKKEKESRKIKLARLCVVKLKDGLSLTFDAWKHYVLTLKNFRRVINLNNSRKTLSNKAVALNTWKSFLAQDTISKLNLGSSLLSNQNYALETELSHVSKALSDQKQFSNQLISKLKEKSRKKLVASLCKGYFYAIRSSLNTWKQFLTRNKLVKHKTQKIINCWNNKELRKVWKKWMNFIKSKLQETTHTQAAIHRKEKKTLRSENKKIRSELEKEIENKQGIIQTITSETQKAAKINDFLLNKGIQYLKQEYSINKAAYFFEIMKQRYYNMKSVLNALGNSIKHINTRRGIRDIKAYCLENLKITSLRNMLVTSFKKFGFRVLRNEFDRWYRNTWHCYDAKLKLFISQDKSKINQISNQNAVIKRKNREKFAKILLNKNKKFILDQWKKIAGILKKTRVAYLSLVKNISFKRQKFGLKLLQLHKESKSQAKYKYNRSSILFTKNITRLCFSSWKLDYRRNKALIKSLKRLYELYQRMFKIHSFSCIKQASSINILSLSMLSKSQQSILKRCFGSKYKKDLAIFLNKWKSSYSYKKSSSHTVKKAFIRALNRKLRAGFSLWNEEILLKDTVDITNTQGPVAIENNILKNRIDLLNKLMEQEGLERNYVDKYILEKENHQSALTLQAIHRNKYKSGLINPKDCSVLPKFFLIWKQWGLKRKKIKKYSHRVLVYLRKSDLLHGFLKWKRGLSLVINTINKLPRRNLFSLVAKMDMDIKGLENKLETSHKSLIYHQTYINLLSTQLRKGQNMALVSCKLQSHKSLYQALIRWSYHTGLCKEQELLEQLTSTEQNFYILKTSFKTLEDDNQTLIDENLELRQASLDGVAIAEAFETLSKERERLSMDLADRTATIKKLIEQNNQLAERLRNIEYESPEMDYNRSNRYN